MSLVTADSWACLALAQSQLRSSVDGLARLRRGHGRGQDLLYRHIPATSMKGGPITAIYLPRNIRGFVLKMTHFDQGANEPFIPFPQPLPLEPGNRDNAMRLLVAAFVLAMLACLCGTPSSSAPSPSAAAAGQRTSAQVWKKAPTCAAGISNGNAGCCCAPRDALPVLLKATRTLIRYKTRRKTRTRWTTITMDARGRRVQPVAKNSVGSSSYSGGREHVRSLVTEALAEEYRYRDVTMGGRAVSGELGRLLPDEDSEPFLDDGREAFGQSQHSLQARHLCPRCPASRGARNRTSGSNTAAMINWCCPQRKTIRHSRTVTRTKRVTRTQIRTRTRTRTKTVQRTTTVAMISSISGILFVDDNGNGIQDVGEEFAPNLAIRLWSDGSAGARGAARTSSAAFVISSTVTGGDGAFLFAFDPIPITVAFSITAENSTIPLAQFSGVEVSEGDPIAVPALPPRTSTTTNLIPSETEALRTSSESSTFSTNAESKTQTSTSESITTSETDTTVGQKMWALPESISDGLFACSLT